MCVNVYTVYIYISKAKLENSGDMSAAEFCIIDRKENVFFKIRKLFLNFNPCDHWFFRTNHPLSFGEKVTGLVVSKSAWREPTPETSLRSLGHA